MAYENHLNIERLCTIKEIAECAGVGHATVHRVLKGAPSVSKRMAARVMHALDNLNRAKMQRAWRPISALTERKRQ